MKIDLLLDDLDRESSHRWKTFLLDAGASVQCIQHGFITASLLLTYYIKKKASKLTVNYVFI